MPNREEIQEYVEQAQKQGITVLNYYDFLDKYPKTTEEFRNFVDLNAGMKSDDETIVAVFLFSARIVMYNFLDDKKKYINITGNNEDGWISNLDESTIFSTRAECECAAFKEAFQQLENI